MDDYQETFWNDAYLEDPAQTILPDHVLDGELEGLPVGTALDLGCGTGPNALKLAERGWEVVGVDFSETAIELARKAASTRGVDVKFFTANIGTWKPPDQYDLVYSTYALPEGKGRVAALHCAAEALQPAGTLLVAEWDESMAQVWKHFSADELVTPDEIVRYLPGLIILKAEVKHIPDFFTEDDLRWHGEPWANVAIVKATKNTE